MTAAPEFDARTAPAAEVEARLKAMVRASRARRDEAKTAAIAKIGDVRGMTAPEWRKAQGALR